MNEVLVVWMTWLDHNMTQEFPRVHNQQLHGRQKYQYIISKLAVCKHTHTHRCIRTLQLKHCEELEDIQERMSCLSLGQLICSEIIQSIICLAYIHMSKVKLYRCLH